MACFLVPLAEGVVVSAVKPLITKSEKSEKGADETVLGAREKIGGLQKMLFGGSFLLAIEHVYHGEVTLVPPFLTAMNTPEEIPVMLREMATSGVGMALLVTAAWAAGIGVSALFKRMKARRAGGAACA